MGRNIEDMLANTRDLDGQTDKRKSTRFCFMEKFVHTAYYAMASPHDTDGIWVYCYEYKNI
jgi:hypothetical protein